MTLTLHSRIGTVHIEISADQFKCLRDPQISHKEIEKIAFDCSIDPLILVEYTMDLKQSAKEMMEIDGSCDYSDHL